jgi:type II secretory pathway pseudopilin PulG
MTHGQSLIEIIIIVGVVVLLVTGLIVAATSSLRFGQQSKSRSQAVSLAREAIEFTREMRDSDWEGLSSRNGTFCLSEAKEWSSDIECPMTIQNQFSRSVVFVSDGSTVEVEVTVSWWESSVIREVKINTAFTDWKTI